MSDKHKTLAECKDEVARKHGHATFNRVRFAGTEAQLKIMDEAAELYAGQTKQSEPVSFEVEQAFQKFNESFDYDKCLTKTGIDSSVAAKAGFIAGWQSQQPASIQWLSDEEIKEIFPISGEKQDSLVDLRQELMLAFSWASSIGEQFFDPTKTVEQMIDIYLTSKTK